MPPYLKPDASADSTILRLLVSTRAPMATPLLRKPDPAATIERISPITSLSASPFLTTRSPGRTNEPRNNINFYPRSFYSTDMASPAILSSKQAMVDSRDHQTRPLNYKQLLCFLR